MKIKFKFENLSRYRTGEAEGALQYVYVDDKRYCLHTTIHKGEDATEFQPAIGDGDDWFARDDDYNVAEFSKTNAWQRFASWFGFDATYRNYTEAKRDIIENVTKLIVDFYDGKVLCERCYGDRKIFISEGKMVNGKREYHFECRECEGEGVVYAK